MNTGIEGIFTLFSCKSQVLSSQLLSVRVLSRNRNRLRDIAACDFSIKNQQILSAPVRGERAVCIHIVSCTTDIFGTLFFVIAG